MLMVIAQVDPTQVPHTGGDINATCITPALSMSSWASLNPRACLVQPGVLALGYTKITAPFSFTRSCVTISMVGTQQVA